MTGKTTVRQSNPVKPTAQWTMQGAHRRRTFVFAGLWTVVLVFG